MQNNSFDEILEKIKNSERILLSLHRGPDGDSLGACTAMAYFLKKLNKNIKLISSEKPEKKLFELPFSRDIEFLKDITETDLDAFDLFLSLDIAGTEMLTKNKDFVFPEKLFIINIDHHDTNSFFGNLNYVSFDKSSTCSILLDFFETLNLEMDREIATRLLLGICTDTLFFKSRNPESAIKDASRLIDKGADYRFILKNVLLRERLELKKFFGMIINNLKEEKEKRLGYSVVSYDEIKNLNLSKSEIRLGTNELAFIDNFDFVFTLIETEENIKGGFRSDSGVDVAVFAKELGGGGHKYASGFFLPKMPLVKAEKKVLEVIDRVGINKN